ncbi:MULTISPECIES: hypothetical protein [unclassified Mesorhizobium]|uniref:hypothetical protein n=1 Tax=unclassified Mesorhizobium TaxID=325217 RepID=UPI0015E46F64|nr:MULTISPECIES: hypothetical protein [unclassified Mesorhizobium]MCA0000964.1 hypothetical protein [Mesorhizobium sp. B264B2A]MCA0004713.1 hypothetical protein [Mesorhizobium sp. B264B1B]MCA0019088.1 hypothetical protein [Mesorhizobium sp. B264B1A]
MADLARIKNNIGKMVAQDAPETDIDAYIASEGVTLDDVRAFRPGGTADVARADASARAGIEQATAIASLSPEERRARVKIDPETGEPPGVPTYQPKTSLEDKAGAFSTGGLQGVPIVGPYLDKASSAAAAAMAMPFTGRSFNELYDEGDRYSQDVRRDNPHTATAGGVTGAVAATVPAMVAAPAAFGIGVESLPLRLMASTGSGAVINGSDAAVRSGGDPMQTAIGTGLGAGLGMAAPVVAPLVGRGVKAIADNVQISAIARALGLDKRAVSVLAKAAKDDAIDPAALPDLGANGMMMDLGPNMRHTAGAIAATPSEGKQIVRGAIGSRDAEANWRIRSTLDDTLGSAPTPSRVAERIDRNQQHLQPEYREALRDAAPVDTLPIARYLEQEAQSLRGEPQRVVQRVRSMLDHQPTPADIARARALGEPPPGTSLVSDAAELLNTRHAIDDMLETTQGSNAVNALTTARQAVDDELRASVPGIKEVDAKYAELARQRTALQRGQTVLSDGREAPRPDELAAEVRQGALPQGMQIGPSAVPLRLREGARAEIERIVGTRANDRVALQQIIKGEGDWNRARLSSLFGADKASAIIDLLDRERLFADTSNIVTRNSESAARLAAQRAVTGDEGYSFGVPEAFMAGGVRGVARASGYKAAENIINALRSGGNEKAISDMARSLTAGQQSPVLAALMKASRGSPLQQSQVDRVARALLLSGPSAGR